MRLEKFRILNYRSVSDSGLIKVGERTALVGRNESGKTNILLALQALKPPGGKLEPFDFAKDFPRDRHPNEFSEDLNVVETRWELSKSERKKLARIFPRAANVSHVRVGRRFKPELWVDFQDLPKTQASTVVSLVQDLQASLRRSKNGDRLESFLNELDEAATVRLLTTKYAESVAGVSTKLQSFAAQHGIEFRGKAPQLLEQIDRSTQAIISDTEDHARARGWVVEQMPVFVYLSEYPHVEGHQDVPSYISRKSQGQKAEFDENFEKLMKIAGLDPQELNRLLSEDYAKRQQLANRAGAVVTKKIRELWTDRELKIRFNLDGQHFDTLISDPNSVYDVEVNLNERSRGFRWFFSFYITLAADTKDGDAKDALLLFDEPGLHLHALGQRDLLRHFATDFTNQIVYTTHSPFMISEGDITEVRTVTISENEGTSVHNNPVGDTKTMFPILHALGMEISQSLFIAEWNLVVEGVTDFWYLTTVSDYLEEQGRACLPQRLSITPAGSSSKVPYMVTLLTSNRLKALVLLDEEAGARTVANNLIKDAKLIREENVLFVSAAFAEPPNAADIEDLLEENVYGWLVEETYQRELEGRSLELNASIPRIVKRYEKAFSELGMQFRKARPARLFFRKMAERPDELLGDEALTRFETLFNAISESLKKLGRVERAPFE